MLRAIAFPIMATLLAGFVPLSEQVQYGGPPMWDRGPNPEYRRERPPFPPPRPYGPQVGPCIFGGPYGNDCRGPRPSYGRPEFRYPEQRYDLYEEDY